MSITHDHEPKVHPFFLSNFLTISGTFHFAPNFGNLFASLMDLSFAQFWCRWKHIYNDTEFSSIELPIQKLWHQEVRYLEIDFGFSAFKAYCSTNLNTWYFSIWTTTQEGRDTISKMKRHYLRCVLFRPSQCWLIRILVQVDNSNGFV